MTALRIPTPYVLFLADAPDAGTAKTAIGVAYWRPEICVGEIRYDDCKATTGLKRLDPKGALAAGAKTIVIGVANAGGVIHDRWIDTLLEALDLGLDVASGLHMRLRDNAMLRDRAQKRGRTLWDVRHPTEPMPIGKGTPRSGHRLLTVGTDCSIGKMFTALALERELKARGVDATFRATGQTGILIAGSGISVDAVVSDFVAGATELLSPANAATHWDLIEGQGSLFHPSFAGVTLGLLHGAQAEALVMCHDPARKKMRGVDYPMPDLLECIRVNEELARLTAPKARVVGVSLNTSTLDERAALRAIEETAERTGLPCADPVRTGVAPIADAIV